MAGIPLWRGNPVSIKELADYFARYVYLPRLKNTEVLLEAIRDGLRSLVWESETFAYADSWDAERTRYLGLKAGPNVQGTLNAMSLLVTPPVPPPPFPRTPPPPGPPPPPPPPPT